MHYEASILRTKLHRPPVAADLVRRKRLLALMDRGLEVPMTLVSAPAGYGKSVLVSEWVESTDLSCAWLSLEETENELLVFLSYLVAAVHTVHPGACPKTEALLDAAELPQLSAWSRHLINELDAIETPFVLVLDDFHRIRDSEVHELLNHLLAHPPRCLHLVVATRRDPGLHLARLRGLGQVVEVRTRDLRFSPAETSVFLERLTESPVDQWELSSLQRVVEGWAVGLRLVGLAMRDQEDPEKFLTELTGSLGSVQRYLVQEVMAGQEPSLRSWLSQISILDRFCASLCDAVCGPEGESGEAGLDGQAFVRALESQGLFSISLDAEREWFRIHHLLQQILHEQLLRDSGPDAVAALHVRASRWFDERGFVEEAIQHALAAGKPALAATALKNHGHELILLEENSRLERLIHLLPRETVDQDPWLQLFVCWAHQIRFQLPEWLATLENAEARVLEADLPPAESKGLKASLDALRSSYSFYDSDLEQALACSKRALESLPPELQRLRIHAVLVRSMTLQMAGRHQDAVAFLRTNLADRSFSGALSQLPLLVAMCSIFQLAARFDDAMHWSRRLEAISEETDLFQHRQWASLYRGIVDYYQNNLGEMEDRLRAGVESPHSLHAVSLIDQAAILAFTRQALGHDEEAVALPDLVVNHALETGNVALQRIGGALRAEIALRQGRLHEVQRWARDFEPAPMQVQYVFYLPEMTLARHQVQLGTPAARREAEALLSGLEEFARGIHFRSLLIQVLALEAILLDDQGDESAALEKLAEAVDEADPGGGLRFFLDLGPRMSVLSRKLLKQDPDAVFVRDILAGFATGEPRPAITRPAMPEPLTVREDEILGLVAKRLRDKEIARELGVSSETVKYHLKNLYQKLGVHNRRDAVTKARELFLIDPS